jgi:hypothetical protein
MNEWLVFVILACLAMAYMNVISSIVLLSADTVENVQKLAQSLIIWFIPIFGALLVLRLAHDAAPDSVPIKWVPRLFKPMIIGKDPTSYR